MPTHSKPEHELTTGARPLGVTTKFSRFLRSHRRDLAAISAAFAVASFGYHIYLWSHFMESQPREPNASLGLIYPMNNHGWYYYLSAAQATQLAILIYASIAFSLLAFAVNLPVPTKQPWERYATVSQLPWKYFVGSLIVSVGTLWLASPYLASFLVSKGIIFDPW